MANFDTLEEIHCIFRTLEPNYERDLLIGTHIAAEKPAQFCVGPSGPIWIHFDQCQPI